MDQSIVSFEKVTHVEIRCACGVGMVLPAFSDSQDLKTANCPACGDDLGTAVLAVKALRKFYTHAKAFTDPTADRKVELRITEK